MSCCSRVAARASQLRPAPGPGRAPRRARPSPSTAAQRARSAAASLVQRAPRPLPARPARVPRRRPPRPPRPPARWPGGPPSASRVETTSASAAASRAATTARPRSRSTPESAPGPLDQALRRGPRAVARSSSRRDDSSAVVEVASASSRSRASWSSCSSSRHTARLCAAAAAAARSGRPARRRPGSGARPAAREATVSCERAAAAWRSRGRIWRRTSRTRSPRRSRFSSVAASRRSARSRRRRCLSTPAASSMMARRSSGRALRTVSSWPWPMIMCCWRPTPESESSSWMSSSRHGAPLMAYSLSPERNRVRVMVTSARSMGSLPDALSMVSETSARPRAGRMAVPGEDDVLHLGRAQRRGAPGRRAPRSRRRPRWTCRCRWGRPPR